MSFRVEYRRGSTGAAMFQRQVRFQVDMSSVTKDPQNPKEALYAITFTLLSGNIRRFRRVCEHIQALVCNRRPPAPLPLQSQQPPPPPSPRATRKFGTDLSESSSCGSDTSERLSPYPGTRTVRNRSAGNVSPLSSPCVGKANTEPNARRCGAQVDSDLDDANASRENGNSVRRRSSVSSNNNHLLSTRSDSGLVSPADSTGTAAAATSSSTTATTASPGSPASGSPSPPKQMQPAPAPPEPPEAPSPGTVA